MSKISKAIRQARLGVNEEPEKQDSPAAQAVRLAAYGAASGRLREREEQEAQAAQSLRLAAYGAAQRAARADEQRPAPSFAGTLRAVPDGGTGTSVARQEYEAGKERARYLDFSTGAELQRRLREAEEALSLSGGGRAEDAAARAAKAELDKWQSDARQAQAGKWMDKAQGALAGLSEDELALLDDLNGYRGPHSPFGGPVMSLATSGVSNFLDAAWAAAHGGYEPREYDADAVRAGLQERYSPDEIRQLREYREAQRNEEQAQSDEDFWRQAATELPGLTELAKEMYGIYPGTRHLPEEQIDAAARMVSGNVASGLTSALSVGLAPYKALGNVEAVRGVLPSWAGGYVDPNRPTDVNSPWFTANRTQQTIRQTVQEKINSPVGRFLYNAGMSAADSALNMALGSAVGGASGLTGQALQSRVANTVSWIMGSQVAADTVMEEVENGYSNAEALGIGIARGLFEHISEKYSVENILKTPGRWYQRLRKSFVSEGAEEVASNWMNRVFDSLIGHKTDVQERYEQIRVSGEPDEALALARALVEVDGEAFLAGGLSGLGMSGVADVSGVGPAIRTGRQLTTGQTVTELEVNGGTVTVPPVDEATAGLIESGLESPEGTESRELAETLLEKAKAGKTISAEETGRLAQANDAEIRAEATEQGEEPTQTPPAAQEAAPAESGAEERVAAPMNTEEEQANARFDEAREIFVKQSKTGEEAGQVLASLYADTAAEHQSALSFAVGAVPYYYAGHAGKAFEDVRVVQSADITPEQARVAWNEGRIAAVREQAAAERAEREAAQKAAEQAQLQREAERNRRLAATEAGLHEDDFTRANLSADDARRIDETARLLGTPVYVVGNNEINAGRANGELVEGRAVLLEQGLFEGENAGTSAGLRIAGHEWGHRLKRLAPTEYGQVVEALRPLLTKEIEQKRHLYNEKNGLNYSDAELTEEAVNDRLGDMLRDGRILDEFIEEHRQERGLLQRLWEGVKTLVRKLTGAEKRAAQRAEAKLRAALDAAARQESSESRVQSSEGTENAAPESGESEFSLKAPIEETKDLLAVHGMTAENLREALRLGGLPMPSIAVVKAEAGHNRYGEISLVFDKRTIDPEADRRNKVYGADAWTPTAPRVDYELDYDGVLKLEDRIEALSKSVADGIFGNSSILRSAGVEDSTSIGVDELAEKLGGTDAVKAAYLAEQGETLDPVKKAKVWGKYGNEALQQLIDRIGPQRLAQINSDLWEGMRTSEALGAEEATIRQIIRDYYIDRDEAILQKRAQRNGWTVEETAAKREAHADSMMENNVSLFTLEDFARNAWAMYEDGGATRGENDYYATQAALRKAVSDKTATEWIRPQIEALYGQPWLYNGKDPYTASGSSRSFRQLHDAYTLENIVRVMSTRQSQRGEGIWLAGAHGLQATATPSYRNIAEIKADSGRLGTVSEEELKRLSDAVNDELDEVVTEIVGTGGYQEREIAGEVLMMAAQGSKTVAAIRNTFARESEYKISEATAKKIQQLYKDAAALPTEYFEAKPQRAVGFDEVLAAVVPTDLDADLKQGLRDAGVQNVLEYEIFNNADRTAKLNSVEGARFSIKEPDAATMEELTRENERLRKRVDYWKGQTKQTRGLHLRLGDLNRLTGQLVKDYAAVLDENESAELREAVARLAKLMRENPKGLQYNEMLYHAEDVARVLVQNASELVNDDEYQDYRDFKKWLKTQKITISRQDAGFIPDFTAWKKAHSAIRVGYDNGGLPIDTAYSELAEQFPGFFPESITNPTDQLERIAEVLDSMGPVYDNPYSADMAAAVEYATFDVLERIMDEDTVRPTPPTRADQAKEKQRRRYDIDVAFARREAELAGKEAVAKAKAKGKAALEAERARNKAAARDADLLRRAELEVQAERYEARLQKYRDTLKKVRERRDEELARVRRAHKMQQQRQSAAKLRARIERHAKELYRELTRPTDKKHVPEALRSSVAKVLQAINLESGLEYAWVKGDYKLVPRGSELGAAGLDPTKKTQLFAAMKEQLAKAEASGEGSFDPNLLGFGGEIGLLDEVIAMGDKPLADMSRDELQKVWDVLKQVEKAVKDWNKAFAAGRDATIDEIAGALWGENAKKQDTLTLAGAAGRAQQLFNLDMLTPEAYFHRLGPTGDALFRALRRAQDNDTRLLDLAVQKAQEVIGDYDVRKAEQETVKVILGGEEAEITRAQLMEIYVLLRREQALKHLEGGILPAATRKGVVQNKRAEPYRLNSIEELAEACAKLTDEERRIAEALQRFVTVTAAEWGNAASMAVYGYRKFGGEEHYWPLDVNRQDRAVNIEKDTAQSSLKNAGFTKPLTPNANNSIRIKSIFDTFAEHVCMMATFSTHLEVMEDLTRILSYKQRNEDGRISWTVQGVMDRVFGGPQNAGSNYLKTLITQLSYGVKGETIGGDFMSATSGRYKGSAIGANLRVILQQPTAILRALDMIRPDYLAEGLGSWRRGWKRAQKYAPIAKWKSWGYFDVATGKSIKSLMFNSDSKLSKFNSALMAPAGMADAFAWGQLWSACEKELEAQIKKGSVPGIEPGTEAFYQRVAERFSEIVDRTQVVDGILQRSQIMRSPDRLVKMATSFMAEPTKQYNQFMSAVYDLRHSGDKKERRAAMKHLARTLLALLASFAANAAAQSLIDGLRDDDREKKYFERFLGAYPGNLLDNVNPLSFVPWARDVSSLIQGYSVDRMDMTTVSNIVNAVKGTTKALQGEGKKSVVNALTTLAAEAARLFGLPVANIKRDVLAIVNTVATETDNFLMQYEIDKVLYPVAANKSRYVDMLYRAQQKDPEQYELLYDKLIADGLSDSDIKERMEDNMKEAQGVTKATELEQRYMSPEQQTRYDGLRQGVERSSLWRQATAEQRERVTDKLYQLVAQTSSENSAGTKLQEKIDAAKEAGISEGEYMLYLLALSMADEPTDKGTYGTYTNDEQEAALDMLDRLSREEKSWLWMSTHDSDKNNPYK